MKVKVAFLLLASIIYGGCRTPAPGGGQSTPEATGRAKEAAIILPSPAPSPPPAGPTPDPVPVAGPRETPPAAAPRVCSPIEGLSVDQLPDTIFNPFHPPARAGSDDPHHGVDFAVVGENRVAQAGREVQAVLTGRVASVIVDRFPYGNAVIIESPLEELDPALQMELPAPAPLAGLSAALFCPVTETAPLLSAGTNSLYLLYAHLQEASRLQPGETVNCGEPVGAIGDSGNAYNPHLHLETRIGPAGAYFSSLAHYTNSASTEEMSNYCTWRISGWFQMVDPMLLLK